MAKSCLPRSEFTTTWTSEPPEGDRLGEGYRHGRTHAGQQSNITPDSVDRKFHSVVFFFSVPLGLIAIFVIVRAFTHPGRAAVSIARFLLGLVGFIAILATLFSFTMINNGPAFWAISAGCVAVLVASFVARNKLSRY